MGGRAGAVELIGNPIKFSETPVDTRQAPPHLGEQPDEVLRDLLGMPVDEVAALRDDVV